MSQVPSKTKPNWVAVTDRPAGLRPPGAHFCRGLWTDAGLFWAPALVLPLSKMPLPLFPSAADGKLEGRLKPFSYLRDLVGFRLQPTVHACPLHGGSSRLYTTQVHVRCKRRVSFISAAAQERERTVPSTLGWPALRVKVSRERLPILPPTPAPSRPPAAPFPSVLQG